MNTRSRIVLSVLFALSTMVGSQRASYFPFGGPAPHFILRDAVHKSPSSTDAPTTEAPLFVGLHAQALLGRAVPAARIFSRMDPTDVRTFLQTEIKKRIAKPARSSADKIAVALVHAANRNQIDPLLLLAVAFQESSLNPNAVGRSGEIGLMQLKIPTARWLARQTGAKPPSRAQLFEPERNLELGAAYLKYLSHRYSRGHHTKQFLKAYNLGPSGLRSKRSTDYHTRVLKHYRGLVQALTKTRLC